MERGCYYDRSCDVACYPLYNDSFFNINNVLNQKIDDITVTYEGTYGFLNNISIDFIKQAVDDKITSNVTEFQISK